jgi:hypothetical protein
MTPQGERDVPALACTHNKKHTHEQGYEYPDPLECIRLCDTGTAAGWVDAPDADYASFQWKLMCIALLCGMLHHLYDKKRGARWTYQKETTRLSNGKYSFLLYYSM